jgi:hypothetical protein
MENLQISLYLKFYKGLFMFVLLTLNIGYYIFFFALKDFSLHIFQMAPLIREENIRLVRSFLSKGTLTQFRPPVSLLPQTLTMELDTYYTKMQAQVGKIGCFPPLLIFCDNSLSIIGV